MVNGYYNIIYIEGNDDWQGALLLTNMSSE